MRVVDVGMRLKKKNWMTCKILVMTMVVAVAVAKPSSSRSLKSWNSKRRKSRS